MMLTAHAGSENTPDNTMESILYSVTLPVQALEADLRLSPEGTIVLAHNEPKDFSTLPTLKQVLDVLSPTALCFNCDLKEPGLEDRILTLAEAKGMAGRIIFSGEVDPHYQKEHPQWKGSVFLNMENILPHCKDALESGTPPTEEQAKEAVDLCCSLSVKVLNLNHAICTPFLAAYAAEKGVGLSLWTVNEEADMEKALAVNPYNITTRRPITLAKKLSCREERSR